MNIADDFEARVLAFERAWQQGGTPQIAEFLPAYGPVRRQLLHELICVDLEYRWRNATRAVLRPFCLEDYVRSFPETGPLKRLPAELIAEEYRVRHRWGNRPSHVEFVRRFGSRSLEERLRRVDADLLTEASETARITTHADPRPSLSDSDILLRRMIGAGGFGKVYAANFRATDQLVAVKFLRKTFWKRPEAVDRFLVEATTVARLRHEGIVPVHGAGLARAGGPFFVMDFVDGSDLAMMQRSRPITLVDAVSWMMQTCKAVAHAHDSGIIHCDLKPSNLLLGSDGCVRVTDFGLARSVDGVVCGVGGTIGFMAPEQLDSRLGSISPATDVYGLGAVLLALLTGKPPRSASTAEVLTAEHLPPAVREICCRCLAERPADRYSDIIDLFRELENVSATSESYSPLIPASTSSSLTDGAERVAQKGDVATLTGLGGPRHQLSLLVEHVAGRPRDTTALYRRTRQYMSGHPPEPLRVCWEQA